jgi:hypothetical protein
VLAETAAIRDRRTSPLDHSPGATTVDIVQQLLYNMRCMMSTGEQI